MSRTCLVYENFQIKWYVGGVMKVYPNIKWYPFFSLLKKARDKQRERERKQLETRAGIFLVYCIKEEIHSIRTSMNFT